jgi:hypothetical protein
MPAYWVKLRLWNECDRVSPATARPPTHPGRQRFATSVETGHTSSQPLNTYPEHTKRSHQDHHQTILGTPKWYLQRHALGAQYSHMLEGKRTYVLRVWAPYVPLWSHYTYVTPTPTMALDRPLRVCSGVLALSVSGGIRRLIPESVVLFHRERCGIPTFTLRISYLQLQASYATIWPESAAKVCRTLVVIGY